MATKGKTKEKPVMVTSDYLKLVIFGSPKIKLDRQANYLSKWKRLLKWFR